MGFEGWKFKILKLKNIMIIIELGQIILILSPLKILPIKSN
jgi:hypothetical protein